MEKLLTYEEITKKIYKIEELGMLCSITTDAIKNQLSITELNECWKIDRSIIRGAINDISLWL
jgi:hypothetical protein